VKQRLPAGGKSDFSCTDRDKKNGAMAPFLKMKMTYYKKETT
jgi:hypothetical protein